MRRTLLIGLSILPFVAGCTLGVVKDAEQVVTRSVTEAAEAAHEAKTPLPPADVSAVKVIDGVYLGSRAQRRENGDVLPRAVERNGVTLARAVPMTLGEIAFLITETTNIPVALHEDTNREEAQTGASTPEPDSTTGGIGTPIGISPMGGGVELQSALQALSGPGGANAAGAVGGKIKPLLGNGQTMRVNYTGSLSGFMNLVSAHFNVGWDYSDGRIRIRRTVTRTFSVPALPIISDLSFTLDSGGESDSGGGEGGGATSESSQSATTTSAFDVWKDIRGTLANIVGDDKGSAINADTSTGIVTVTSTPSVVRAVETYLKKVNQELSKQVALSVRVLNVSLTDADDYGFDLQTLFSGSKTFQFTAGNMVAEAAAEAVGQSLGWGIIRPGSDWVGTNGVVRALSEKGDVSVVTTASVTTINGVPVPLQVASTRSFLERVSVTRDENSVSTELSPGKVTTGFNLHLVPRIFGDGRLMLQYGINISELVGKEDGFDTYSTADLSIQLPNISQRNFVQQAIIPNGSTLALAGFEQVSASSSKTGTGKSDFWLLGGGQNANMRRDVMVILITPVLLDSSLGE